MIGLTVITHGEMAEGIRTAVRLILGEQEQFRTLGLREGADFEAFKEEVRQAVLKTDTGQGALILVDLLGASPYNASAFWMTDFLERGISVRLITGVNLPMVISALTMRGSFSSVEELYGAVMEEGRAGIREMMEELGLSGICLN